MYNSICRSRSSRGSAARCTAIPLVKGLVSKAVTTEIPLSKYSVDLLITLGQRCVVSSEFGGVVFQRRVGFSSWTWV